MGSKNIDLVESQVLDDIVKLCRQDIVMEVTERELKNAIFENAHALRGHGVVFEAQLHGWCRDNGLKAEYVPDRKRWYISRKEERPQ